MGYLTEQIADEVGRLTQDRGRQYFCGALPKASTATIFPSAQ